MIHMHKIIYTLHISIVIFINRSGSKFNKIAIIIILITIINKYRRHIVIIINFLLNSRWTENNIIIIYRRHSIIKVNFLLYAWGLKISCSSKPASPSLDFSIELAIMVSKALILITLLSACKQNSMGFLIFSSNTSCPNSR